MIFWFFFGLSKFPDEKKSLELLRWKSCLMKPIFLKAARTTTKEFLKATIYNMASLRKLLGLIIHHHADPAGYVATSSFRKFFCDASNFQGLLNQ
jgi:hypothetical protein